MEYQMLLLALFNFIGAVWAAVSTYPAIFHGTSFLTLPSDDVSSPASDTNLTAYFFSYMTEKGYFSFGRWISAADSIDNTLHYQQDLDSSHWLELAETKFCDEETGNCVYHVQHVQSVPIRQPDDVKLLGLSGRSLKYAIQLPVLRNEDSDLMRLIYIDDDGVQIDGFRAAQKLSGEKNTARECQKALRTLERYYEINDIDLGFEIRNICAQDRDTDHNQISEL